MKKRTLVILCSILLVVVLGLITACRPTVIPEPDPGINEGPVLIWQREGGIAGFCDGLNIFADGRVNVTTCQGEVVESNTLSPDQQTQLAAWVDRLVGFEKTWSDGAVADSMTVLIRFFGGGVDTASEDEMQVMSNFAADIYANLAMDGSTLDPAADMISWEHAVALILGGHVKQVTQTHALEVTLSLKDYSVLTTTEPAIDDVFKVIASCGSACTDMVLATE